MKTAKKPAPKKRAAAKPIKAKAKSKPNIHQRAKAAGINPQLPDAPKPEVVFRIDPDIIEALELATGRPTILTAELGSRVCSLVAQRHSLKAIEQMEGLPSENTIYRWLGSDAEGPRARLYAAFRETFARARALRAQTRIEALVEYERRLTDTRVPDSERLDAQIVRAAKELQETLMACEDPGTFGKSLTLKGSKGAPIEVRNAKQLTREELMAIANGGLDGAET
jgi:hypothetical protein